MNLRVIKKDIEFLVNDFVADCLIFSDFHNGEKDAEVKDLVTEGLVFANQLFARVNHPVKDEKGSVKAHYKAINKELLEGFDKLFEKLSQLAK
jgi:hypothetical protein